MTDAHDLISRNAEFAARGFNADLTINPSAHRSWRADTESHGRARPRAILCLLAMTAR
jgi:hypothetical protein